MKAKQPTIVSDPNQAMLPKFCNRCGTKLSIEAMTEAISDNYFSGTQPIFDSLTGKRRTAIICRKCHPCDHVFEELRNKWYYFIFGSTRQKCVKCGIISYIPD